ncbi:hypothetical protein K0B04_01655 [Patescibacteria group bacterium]|nr:hypothetical protein [Patescibacteria group bacterium]
MNTLKVGLGIFFISVIFVNVVLFGFFKISLNKVPLGALFLIQGTVALFLLYLYKITKKRG